MILVLSDKAYEQGTDPVIDWLVYYKADFLRLSLDDFTNSNSEFSLDILNQDLKFNGVSIIDKINVIWYRRLLNGEVLKKSFAANVNQLNLFRLQNELKNEIKPFLKFSLQLLKDKTWLPRFDHTELNKLEILTVAKRNKYRVPQTKIINNKRDLKEFYFAVAYGLITKPISNTFYYQNDKEHSYLAYTSSINEEMLENFTDVFFPSLFQERISSVLELRVFYLDGVFFTQAIRKNSNEAGYIDIKQNRSHKLVDYIPYKLSHDEESNLHQIMKDLDLTIGCIDILVTPKGELVFLEVNPGGQYLFESQSCNFYLQKAIAEWLIKNNV